MLSVFNLAAAVNESAYGRFSNIPAYEFQGDMNSAFNESTMMIITEASECAEFDTFSDEIMAEAVLSNNGKLEVLYENVFTSIKDHVKKFFEKLIAAIKGIIAKLKAYIFKMSGNSTKWMSTMKDRVNKTSNSTFKYSMHNWDSGYVLKTLPSNIKSFVDFIMKVSAEADKASKMSPESAASEARGKAPSPAAGTAAMAKFDIAAARALVKSAHARQAARSEDRDYNLSGDDVEDNNPEPKLRADEKEYEKKQKRREKAEMGKHLARADWDPDYMGEASDPYDASEYDGKYNTNKSGSQFENNKDKINKFLCEDLKRIFSLNASSSLEAIYTEINKKCTGGKEKSEIKVESNRDSMLNVIDGFKDAAASLKENYDGYLRDVLEYKTSLENAIKDAEDGDDKAKQDSVKKYCNLMINIVEAQNTALNTICGISKKMNESMTKEYMGALTRYAGTKEKKS